MLLNGLELLCACKIACTQHIYAGCIIPRSCRFECDTADIQWNSVTSVPFPLLSRAGYHSHARSTRSLDLHWKTTCLNGRTRNICSVWPVWGEPTFALEGLVKWHSVPLCFCVHKYTVAIEQKGKHVGLAASFRFYSTHRLKMPTTTGKLCRVPGR